MKYEWRKKDKLIYLPKNEPTITTLEPMNYITITGNGSPNDSEFSECVTALYSLAYGIRMSYKGENRIDGYYEYTVFPLEGFWSFNSEGIALLNKGQSVKELKDYLTYTVMLRQPGFVTKDVFDTFKSLVYAKKKNDKLMDLRFETIEEGLVCQMLHLGSYDDEPQSFKTMEEYCKINGYERTSKNHKEIYLSDPAKVSVDKLKTTIRFKVKKI